MEDLESAIEDAQYMTAIHDDVPKPTQSWKKPTPEQMKLYFEKQPTEIDASYLCSGSLGFFMFLQFCKDTKERIMSEFILDVALFRCQIKSPMNVGAKQILDHYLLENSSGNKKYYEVYVPRAATENTNNSILNKSERSSVSKTSRRKNQVAPISDIIKKVDLNSRPPDIKRKLLNLSFENLNTFNLASKTHTTAEIIESQGSNSNEHPETINGSSSIDVTTSPVKNELNAIVLKPSMSVPCSGSGSKPKSTSLRWQAFIDGSSTRVGAPTNLLRLTGLPIDQVKTRISNQEFTLDMFDELDEIVFQHITSKHFKPFQNSALYVKYCELMAAIEIPTIEDDFMIFRTLGRGGFGLVSSCKRAFSGKMYAMKMMNKKRIKLKKSEKLCLNELTTLKAIDSKFIVCLRYAFTSPTDIFLILDIMTGGDLGFHLQRKGQFTTKESRYYVARILSALKTLHELKIVYRDLKPENILMDHHGRTRISDLGLATVIGPEGISGACGTRGYWAPECIRKDKEGKREKYNITCDYFSLGVVLYEFIYGVGPFRTLKAKTWGLTAKDLGLEDTNEPIDMDAIGKLVKAKSLTSKVKDAAIDRAILEMEPEYPDTVFTEVSKDLIQMLLRKDKKTRLGSGPTGIEEIMSHEFFKPINFNQLEVMEPPFKPDMKSINAMHQGDIGSFRDSSEADLQKLTPEDHDHYKTWDYVCKTNYESEIVEFLLYEEVMGPILPEREGSCCSLS